MLQIFLLKETTHFLSLVCEFYFSVVQFSIKKLHYAPNYIAD